MTMIFQCHCNHNWEPETGSVRTVENIAQPWDTRVVCYVIHYEMIGFNLKNPEMGLATSARDEIPSQGPRSLYTYPTWTMMAGLPVA